MKMRFQQRLKDDLRGHLCDPIGHRWNTQRPLAATLLGYFHSADRRRKVTARGHSIPQLIQIVLQASLKAFNRLPIDPSSSSVALDRLKRYPHKFLWNLV